MNEIIEKNEQRKQQIKELIEESSWGELIQVFSMVLGRMNTVLNIRESKIKEKEKILKIK
jgi:hypothetical protein